MPRSFDIAEPVRDPRRLLLLFTLVPTAVILGSLYAFVMPKLPVFVPVAMLAIVVVQNVAISRLIDRRKVTLDGGTLEVVAAIGKQVVSASEIDLDRARVLRLDEHVEWKPFLRTGGLGMPGLSLGWFRTRGMVRVYCLLTEREHVLVLPLRGKKEAILLSLKRPDELLAALRSGQDAGIRKH